MPDDRTPSVFLSYSRLESEFAFKLAADLKNAGVRLWMDKLEGIRVGDDWRNAIEDALDSSRAIVAVLSPGYVGSQYCRNELARADVMKTPILAALIQEVLPTDWPIEIQRGQYEDFSSWRDDHVYRARLEALLRRLADGGQVGPPPDAETRYLTSLIAEMESRRGVIQYVELAADADATADHRPAPAPEDEWGFVLLMDDPTRDAAPARAAAASPQTVSAKERLPGIAAAADRFARFVIVGEPGAGKTTALRRLIRDAAWRRRENPQIAPLPLWIDLPTWRDDATPADLVRSRWTLSGDPAAALRAGDVQLFLDGLNEMGDRGAAHAKQLREWMASSDGPSRAILTCRAADYASDALRLGALPTVLIRDLEESQIQSFAASYLHEKAPAFLERILPGPAAINRGHGLAALAKNPYMLAALIFVFEHAQDGDLPRNHGRLFRRLARALWDRERQRRAPGWIPFDQAEQACAALALAMLDEDRGTAVSEEYAADRLGSHELLVAALSATFLRRDGESVRFYHQLMQEYFAAVKLEKVGVQARFGGASYQFLPGGVRSDPLEWTARTASKWDEAIVALCGIVQQPSEVIASILRVDPSLAARCVASGVLLDPEIRQRTIDQLVTSLREEGGRVSVAMAHAIQALGDPAAAPGLVAILRGGPQFVRGSTDVRETAALALGGCPDAVARAGLIEAIGCDSKPVAIRAIRSLGRIGDASDVPALVGILWNDEPAYLFFSTSSTFQREAVESLKRIGARTPGAVIPAVIEGLRSPDARIRRASAMVLSSVHDGAAAPRLLDALVYDADSGVRNAAHMALRQFRDAGAVSELLQGLRRAESRARIASAEGLGSVGDAAAVQGLIDALTYDVDPEVRTASATALGGIGDAAAVPHLLQAFRRDPDRGVVRTLARALVGFRDARFLQALQDRAHDRDSEIRMMVVRALWEIGGADASSALEPIIQDDDRAVAQYAADALAAVRKGEGPR